MILLISVKINVNDGIENGINENILLTACKLIEKAGADLIQLVVIGLNIK
jgi:hypothetical protein